MRRGPFGERPHVNATTPARRPLGERSQFPRETPLPQLPPVALLSVANAVPLHVATQTEARALAGELFTRRTSVFERLAPVFDNAGIAKRHLVRPLEWYRNEHGWRARNDVYLEAAEALYVEAATRALDEAGVGADEIDTLVTVSTTGIATPSLEARVAGRMGWRHDVERVPVFGLGCAGGVSGLAIAARLAAAGKTVLFVTVELCSTSIRLDKLTKANIVATALFGDGAAACVLRGGLEGETAGLARIEGGAERLWPDTLGIMGWDVDDPGLGVIFDRAIPPFVEEHMAEAVTGISAKLGVDAPDRFTCHPGGAKVVAALEASLTLEAGALDHERAVLADYGNMSAPTVLFVLRRLLDHGFGGRTMLLALGPGFTTTGLSVRVG